MSEQPPNPTPDPTPTPSPTPTPTPLPGTGSGSDRERALIEGALRQASPRPAGELFPPRARGLPKDAIPGYEIVREVHRGGQGVVYLAVQRSTQRKVAIKVIHGGPLAGDRERARIEREVRILAGLDHPGIVKVHDSGVLASGSSSSPSGERSASDLGLEGAFYFVMDYVSGHTLDALIGTEPKPIDQVLRLFIEICEAVSAAHLRGVIHRDLKPSNIRLDAGGRPHILDFGLAKIAAGADDSASTGSNGNNAAAGGKGTTRSGTHPRTPRVMTMTGQFVGSLPWASPEQASGLPDKVDLRTDVYSLGVILYQMLTGRFPYPVIGQMRDVLDNILKAEPARPSTVRRQINNEVETIVLKCLAKEPERRYQSAGELARDLHRYLRGEPIEAKRDSGWYVIGKHLRRHRGPVAAAIGALALLIVFAGVMALMYTREAGLKDQLADQLAQTQAESRAKAEALDHARANFDASRNMARVFMSDLADGLEDLRGATPVRERLLVAARASLERLAAEALRVAAKAPGSVTPDKPPALDPALRRELAEAHDRVGDIEAGLYLPRTGTTAQGAAHYDRARTIRETLIAEAPNEPANQLAMAESLRRAADALLRSGKATDSIPTYDRAVALIDSALTTLPATETRARQSRIEALADAAWARVQAADAARDTERAPGLIAEALASYGEIESYWRDRFRADVGDRLAVRRLGRVTDQRARAHVTLGRALSAAASAATKAGQADDAARLARDADASLREAVRLGELAALDFERLHGAHPQSGILRREQMLALYNTGDALMRMGDAASSDAPSTPPTPAPDYPAASHYRAALAKFTLARALAEELVAADASNLSARRELALVLNKLGNTQRDLSRLNLASRAEALATFERSLAIRQDLFATDPTEQHRRDLAVAFFKLGEIEKLGAESATGTTRTEALARARLHYTRSREAFQALVAASIAVRESETARVNQDLADIEDALRKAP